MDNVQCYGQYRKMMQKKNELRIQRQASGRCGASIIFNEMGIQSVMDKKKKN